MPGGSRRDRSAEVHHESLYAGRAALPRVVTRGMLNHERYLLSQFNAQRRRRKELAKHLAVLRSPLRKVAGADERTAGALRGLRKIHASARKRKAVAPRTPKQTRRVFAGSFGARVTPP